MSIDYERIKRLVALVEQNALTELAVEEDDLSIVIKAEADPDVPEVPVARQTGAADVAPLVSGSGNTASMSPAVVEEPVEVEGENLFHIESPMIGVFYRRPSPDSLPYVEVGDEIEVGQTLGLIEAMKVFSEVPSEVAGRVLAVPADSGKLVQEGDVLVIVDTSKTS